MENSSVSIAIIDTGVSNIEQLNNANITEYRYSNGCVVCDTCHDIIGHGTAVTYLVAKAVPSARLFMFQLSESTQGLTAASLEAVLSYIDQYLDVEIINLSIGVTYCEDLCSLKAICERLTRKGVIIVAGFDNAGAISYPAAFDNVIGVGCSSRCKYTNQYLFIEGSSVNILGYASSQRLPWGDGTYRAVAGSSFVAPRITGIIAKIMQQGYIQQEQILNKLKLGATSLHIFKPGKPLDMVWEIKKAIVFPVNKEIETLLFYRDMLSFSISGVYTVRGITSEKTAHDGFFSDIDWTDDFDTVILGHMEKINLINRDDYTEKILLKCAENKKNVFAFDCLDDYTQELDGIYKNGAKVYIPRFTKENLSSEPFGKLRCIGKPVICVCGTTPRQGKFSLQLLLRKELLSRGYSVGQLGTEPSAQLFGMNYSLPTGYQSTVEVSGGNMIRAVNQLMGEIENTNPDIILLGLQSQTVPANYGNINMYPSNQLETLLGACPDGIILCVNAFDSYKYVKRVISFVTGLLETQVLAIVLSPLSQYEADTIIGATTITVDRAMREEAKTRFEEYLNLPVYEMNDEVQIKQLVDRIELFFE